MSLGFPEMIVILGVGLVFFGPKKIPELAKSLGKGIRDFKRAVNGEDDSKNNLPPDETNKKS